ncbi:MAG TPA: SagB/ThcOx family dehydrogenase [Clostridia bacterium]|nr:SagB/ThcOx family dehydrogenase [Clostridia bacterium]
MDLWEQFLEMTKSKNSTVKGERPLEAPDEKSGIQLPSYQPEGYEIFAARRTIRDFTADALTIGELSFLLWATQGATGENARGILRTAPSAGATHPLDTYLMIRRVKGIKPGIYKFIRNSNMLAEVNTAPGACEKFTEYCKSQPVVQSAAVVFFWVSDINRSYWRFGNRAYRYLFIDAGHICGNLYFAAQAVNCGVCAIGAFDDDAMNSFLGLDGIKRMAVYGAAVGKK